MDKETQRATLFNVHNALQKISFKGSEVGDAAEIMKALAAVHDALGEEVKAAKEAVKPVEE